MYGPIKPLTNAIGNKAAMTAKVANIVGPPTSSTAIGIMSVSGASGFSFIWRWMFSTTTIASSTKIPMEKIRANNETRLRVNPHAQDANNVAIRVNTTAVPTIAASRLPKAKNTNKTTADVANISLWMSFCALSLAVSP